MFNLKVLRINNGLNMKQVAAALNIPYTTYVSYEKGNREPNREMLIKMADFYHTTIDYILNKPEATVNYGYDSTNNIIPLPKTKLVPLLGTIACGTPIFAEENVESMVSVPEQIRADFALRCKGDSMIGARIFDNDIVYIQKQNTVENGEIAAVLINDEATLKRFYRYGNTVVLRAENPAFKEIEYSNEDINKLRILGKAVYFLSKIN